MILSELTGYLAMHRRVSLTDMSHRFGSDPDALRGMLAVLERKGRARRVPAEAGCSGCGKCDPSSIEVYEWVDADSP